MKTAEEFLEQSHKKYGANFNIIDCMTKFAKYHVQKSLEEASTVAELVAHQYIEVAEDEEYNKEAVLNAYPLENIK